MPYEGRSNYIFVSYAHKDSAKVLPYIEVLEGRGFRVWYDAGIEAGTEWPEYIEEHLKNAAVVLVFMTPNTVDSKNCRNEINFALELDKEILVVYLEDTTLLRGMRLQLNSTQSLFRNNHETNESFVRELVNARILRSCHGGAGNDPVVPPKMAGNNRASSKIANICSIGTNNTNDVWPKGQYSPVINRDEFSVVFFHIKLLKTLGFTGTIHNKYQIYNWDNNLVFENEVDLNIRPDYDRVSTGWVLRGDDGGFIPSGEYRFVAVVNNSPAFTYFFKICSNDDAKAKAPQKKSFYEKIRDLFKN